jgi:hypothetical protein
MVSNAGGQEGCGKLTLAPIMQVHNCITMYRGCLTFPFGSLCVKADLSRSHCVHITFHPILCLMSYVLCLMSIDMLIVGRTWQRVWVSQSWTLRWRDCLSRHHPIQIFKRGTIMALDSSNYHPILCLFTRKDEKACMRFHRPIYFSKSILFLSSLFRAILFPPRLALFLDYQHCI